MWQIAISILSELLKHIKPVLGFLRDKVWPFIKKHYKIVIGIVLAGLLGWYVISRINNIEEDRDFWRNEAGRLQGVVEIKTGEYEAQVTKVKEITIQHEWLKKRLDEQNRKLYYYQNLSLVYKAVIDSMIATYKPDTIMVVDTLYPGIDSTSRIFDVEFNNELRIRGYFQTREPYSIYFKDFLLKAMIDIAVSRREDGNWYTNVSTNSKYLKVDNLKTFVTELPASWEFLYGMNINLQQFKQLNGIDLFGGIKRGSWAGTVGVGYVEKAGTVLKIGLIKFGVF